MGYLERSTKREERIGAICGALAKRLWRERQHIADERDFSEALAVYLELEVLIEALPIYKRHAFYIEAVKTVNRIEELENLIRERAK